MSLQLNGCENNNTQAESKIDAKTTDTGCATEFTRPTQATVIHNLCRDHHEVTAHAGKSFQTTIGCKKGSTK